jgi:outer membrane protein assembly factor BamD (BamD/ComL family)
MSEDHPPHPTPPSAPLPRYAAIVILFLTLSTCTLQVLSAVDQMGKPDATGPAFTLFLPAVMSLLVGVGMAAVLDALARLLERDTHVSPDLDAAVMANTQLLHVVAELREAVQASVSMRATAAAASPPPAMQRDLNSERHLLRVVQLLEQLNEATRRQSSAPIAAPAPAPAPAASPPALARPVAAREPEPQEVEPAATPVAAEPEPVHEPEPEAAFEPEPEPEPEPVAELEPQPIDAEAAESEMLHAQLQDLMASSKFDEALLAVNEFARRHPDNTVAPQLVQHIVREADVFVDRTTSGLFEEIRTCVERRQWRRALEVSQQLLEKFPQHSRSGKIRLQLRAIQHNAEMEERQVQEVRIQDLIKARRLAEAIDLSEDLIRRFPQSSQANTLTELLPRVRERAGAQESTGSGVFAS